MYRLITRHNSEGDGGATTAMSRIFYHQDLAMKIFLQSFLPLLLIQEERLSVNGKIMYIKSAALSIGKIVSRRLAQE